MSIKKYGNGGDTGLTAAGTYAFTVPAGVTSIVAQARSSGGTLDSTGDTAGVQDASLAWLLRVAGGAAGNAGAAGGTVITGTGYPGGAGAALGGGGAGGPTGAGGNASGSTGGAAGTGGEAGAGGPGYVKSVSDGGPGGDIGGGGGSPGGGMGGGGGAWGTQTISVTPGDVLNIIVPARNISPSGGWYGSQGQVRLDYTVDLNSSESGSLQVWSDLDTDTFASGPAPWLWWSPSQVDSLLMTESATLEAASALSAADTFTVLYPETGSLEGVTTLTQSDDLAVAIPLSLDVSDGFSGADGYGPGWAEIGTLSGVADLSGTDALGLGYVESGAFNLAAILSGSDELLLPTGEVGTLVGSFVLSGADAFETPTVHAEVGTIAIGDVLQGSDSLAIIVPPEGVPVFSYDSERRYVYAGHLIVSRQPVFSRRAQ